MLESTLLALAIQCAPHAAPDTVLALARHESTLNSYAVNVNAPNADFRQERPRNRSEAISYAKRGLAAGYSVDVGLMQINSRHFERFNVNVDEAFDECQNLAMGATILAEFYVSARRKYGTGDQALLAALSAYNTGSFHRGYKNGYLERLLFKTRDAQ